MKPTHGPGSVVGDEGRQHLVAARERLAAVVRPEAACPATRNSTNCANTRKPESDEADGGVALAPRDQQALDQVVIGAVRGERQERAAQQARPEACTAGAGRRRSRTPGACRRRRPSAWRVPNDTGSSVDHRDQAHERAREVDEHLDGVGPDGGGDAALFRVEDHRDAQHGDAPPLGHAGGDRQHQRCRVQADAVAERAVEQEDARGRGAHGRAEAASRSS